MIPVHYEELKQRASYRLVCLTLFCLTATARISPAQDPALALEESIIKVVEEWEHSVVSIARYRPSPLETFNNEHQPFPLQSKSRDIEVRPNDLAAGCLVSPPNSDERLILTNFHVVRGGPVFPNSQANDSTQLIVTFSDHRSCHGSIIAADPRSDLAVLRLEWDQAGINPANYKSFQWESAASPRKGQFVILLGNPYAIARDGSASVSWGMISNLTRQPISPGLNPLFDVEDKAKVSMLYRLGAVMQLDARMNLGMSGGPVLNLKGELIGIGSSLAAIEGYDQSVGFALPFDDLTRRIVRTLLAGQEVEYGMIGIFPDDIGGTEFQRRNTGLPQQSAAIVSQVSPNSPAGIAGILNGDVIFAVDGKPVLSRNDLFRMVGMNPPESELEISIWRERGRPQKQDLKIKLAKWPVLDDEGIIETNPRHAPWRGLSVDFPTAIERLRDRDNSFDMRRVLVTRVKPHSPAEQANIQAGNFITHVNKIPVQSPAEFHAAVKGLSGPVTIRLEGDPRSSIPEIRKGRLVSISDFPESE